MSPVIGLSAVRSAAVGIEAAGVGIGIEAERFDLTDACGGEAGEDVGFEVEMRLACRASREEALIAVIDLVIAGGDGGADGRGGTVAAGAELLHVERLQKTFPNSQPALGYGLTETNAVGCANFWGNYAAKPASTGREQIPFVEVAILGANDAHLPANERGEVGIRSAANIKCYWQNPEATAAAFTADGFLRTGDIGYLDEDRYLFIVDRKKDIIIRGGENISAAEVEAALYANPDVAEAAVFAAPDERLGEVPMAILHCRDGASLDEAALRDFLQGKLAAFKIPARMIFSAEPLPRLGTGKIDRVELKEKYAH